MPTRHTRGYTRENVISGPNERAGNQPVSPSIPGPGVTQSAPGEADVRSGRTHADAVTNAFGLRPPTTPPGRQNQ